MTKTYISAMSKMQESANPRVVELFSAENRVETMRPNAKYKTPEYLFHLNAEDPLFDEHGHLTFYNRRLRDGAPVYVLAQ